MTYAHGKLYPTDIYRGDESSKGKAIPGLANPKYWKQPNTIVKRDYRERVRTLEVVVETYKNGHLVNKRVIPIGAYKSNAEEMRAISRIKQQFVPRRTPEGVEVIKIYSTEYVVDADEPPRVVLLWEEKAY